ncbi:MAG: tetratricopeptide repeat protein [Candidatus Sumerlaeota bacterium]|nr:tetratricopeptide repeat protein [Candidatus Sumerlaeota bacterium]
MTPRLLASCLALALAARTYAAPSPEGAAKPASPAQEMTGEEAEGAAPAESTAPPMSDPPVTLEQASAMLEDAPRPESQWTAQDRRVQDMIDQALADAQAGNRAQAKRRLQAIAETFPDVYPVVRAKYEAALLEDEVDGRLTALQDLIGRYPTSQWATEAMLEIGEFGAQADRVDLSLQALQGYLARRPGAANAADVEMRAADCLRQLDRPEEAIEQYEKILAGNPSRQEVEKVEERIALCQIGLKRYSDAVQEIEKIIAANPRYTSMPALLLTEGLCLEEMKQLSDAKTRYSDLLALYPRSMESRMAQARLDDLSRPLLTVREAAAPPSVAPTGVATPASPTPGAAPANGPASPRSKMSITIETPRPATR